MNARLRRPAVALITTTLAVGALGFAPAAHAEVAMSTITGKVTGSGAGLEDVQVSLYTYDVEYERVGLRPPLRPDGRLR